MTFAAWLEAWWETAADLRPSTRARDRSYFNSMVLPRFGTTPLAVIKQRDVQAWVADLRARGFAPATVVKAYQLLGRTMTAAVNADMIARSPCRAVRLPKVEREIIARQNLVQRLAQDQRRYEELAKLQRSEVDAIAQALREQIQAETRRSFWSNLAINLALSIGSAVGGALFGIWYERRVLVRRRDSTVQ